jgi:hypothetical protein
MPGRIALIYIDNITHADDRTAPSVRHRTRTAGQPSSPRRSAWVEPAVHAGELESARAIGPQSRSINVATVTITSPRMTLHIRFNTIGFSGSF